MTAGPTKAAGPRKGQKPIVTETFAAILLSARQADTGQYDERRSLCRLIPHPASRPLPDRPDLDHLKNQAKDLLRAGGAPSLAAAQHEIARQYGLPSWPKLKVHVESLTEIGQLKDAIDANDSMESSR